MQVPESKCALVVSTPCGPTGAFFFSMTFVQHHAGVPSAHVGWHVVCHAMVRFLYVYITLDPCLEVIPFFVFCLV
jgi:hypothetical protein